MELSYSAITLFFFFFSFVASNPSDSYFKTTYDRLCNTVVPAPTAPFNAETSPRLAEFLRFQSGYFSGGDPIFNRSTAESLAKHVFFHVNFVRKTSTDGVHKLQAQLVLRHREVVDRTRHRSLAMVYPGRRVSHWRVLGMNVHLNGFWSQSSGKLCMFGTGNYGRFNRHNVNVVLKLSYPNDVSLSSSLITGTLETFDDMKIEPISILALSQSPNYSFKMIENKNDSGCVAGAAGESLNLSNLNQGACSVFSGHRDRFRLEYGSNCHNASCSPLGGGGDFENLPGFMHFYPTRCVEKRKIHMMLGFPNMDYNEYVFPFYPNTTLISEGVWDEKENQLCAVVCRILNFTGSPYVGDCSIKLTLRFPAVLSLRNRSTVFGRIWSDKLVGESGYFSSIGFEGNWKASRVLPGLQYKYTEIDRVRKSCGEKVTARGKEKKYPDGLTSDMAFSLSVTNTKGQVTQGYSSPLFVGDQIYDRQTYGVPFMPTNGNLKAHSFQFSSSLNVSYAITLNHFKLGSQDSETKIKINAEGLYNRKTGVMCLVGCRHLRTNDKILIKNDSLDCEIMVNVQFPPMNSKGGESVKGTIESTRQKVDPYYFEPLQLSSYSIYRSQVDASIWRMDFEIIMVLISNTLSCVFVGLQLFHVKKHSEVLPHISIVMLLVITLGHMIPLMLNFEALFKVNHNSVPDAFLGSGGWLEVNEVIVRMVTMVAFLLELRLVQLTWSSRQGEESQISLWASEKRVLYMTLPLYIGGGLIAWLGHIWKNSSQKSSRPLHLSRHRSKFPLVGQHSYQGPSLWADFKSYAGLLLDGFLLPQILFNVLSNSGEKSLASSFYFGTTIVRILPHAYDLYRTHSSSWYLDMSYIYADHGKDFYSTVWDIIIPIAALLFAFLVYFQQRFGSRCFLPKRFRETSSYEKVPVIGNDDL
ncbi:hypothetical protein L195_g000263 [Trifolium pratense]|uniref:RING-type E3 ubiquitin transferase n=1 Tax=Trifolium pratense TaxID=57577 RepID=A0A2K3NLF3_TRIPR|nr:hypothetical protein L195_g000263 [Trifolium pratense]